MHQDDAGRVRRKQVRGKLGPDILDDKSMTILNRCIEWTQKGIMYEADPRHVEILIKQMSLEETKPVVSPGTKGANLPDDQNPHLDPACATKFRQLIARCNFMSRSA